MLGGLKRTEGAFPWVLEVSSFPTVGITLDLTSYFFGIYNKLTRLFYIFDTITTTITIDSKSGMYQYMPKEDEVDYQYEKLEHSEFHLDQCQLQLPMVPRILRSKYMQC